MKNEIKWWAEHKGSKSGPCESREQAAAMAFTIMDAKEVMTGYGSYGAYFNILWMKRPCK